MAKCGAYKAHLPHKFMLGRRVVECEGKNPYADKQRTADSEAGTTEAGHAMTDMTREQALKNMQEWLVVRESYPVGEEIHADWALTCAAQWAQIAEALRPEPTTYVGGGPG